MTVLGVHLGHDSSAGLVIDGRIVPDATEERFNRVKHFSCLPAKAVQYCLDAVLLTIRGLNAVGRAVERAARMALNHLLALQTHRLVSRPCVPQRDRR